MVYKRTISPEVRAYVKFHGKNRQKHAPDSAALVKKLVKECKISQRSVYRLLKEPLLRISAPRKRPGRKPKLSERTEKRIVRSIGKLRQFNKNWTAKSLMTLTDVTEVSERTFQRLLNRNGYHHEFARKKGVLSEKDIKQRLCFAKKHVDLDQSFWEQTVAFFFDGAGFKYKTNPYDDAISCQSKVWRKKCEGLHPKCTAKGSKVGSKQAKFFVAISYDRGVILAEQYEKLTGQLFAEFVQCHFEKVFQRSGKSSRIWLQDGDPSQNSKKSKNAQQEIDAELFKIPPRSPELNPIENVFALVKKELRLQATQNRITTETYPQYCLRVRATLLSVSVKTINTIIGSYKKRLQDIISNKGGRINY